MTTQTLEEPVEPAARPPARSIWTPRRVRLAGVLVGVALAGTVLTVLLVPSHAGSKQSGAAVPPSWRRHAVSMSGLADRSGVRITEIAVTGGGGLVDLRYEVVDPNLATDLHDPTTPPAIMDEATGLIVHDLLMSHSHAGPFRAGSRYYLIFNNPGNWVHRGSKVTVLLGSSQVAHLRVR